MRTAIFSTFPPRACGIGTFSFDVRRGLLDVPGVDDVSQLVVIDEPSSPQRPEILRTASQGARGDYVRAARALARTDVDVVLLQHEYGIYGGRDGEYVLSFVRELSQPLVVTLHTILSEPTSHQLEVLTALCAEAQRVIVMTETGRRMLGQVGACADEKIDVIPHGAPIELGRARGELDAGRRPRYVTSADGGYAGIESRFLLSTFGLLSPGKGIEVMLDALPAIVEQHPNVLYVVAGRTHPQVARRRGEEYRLMLERRIADLDLAEHVVLDDRFLDIDELADLLAATDVFVTPYANREQSSSGALTFALAAGCAVVSTPYWYATDMLASGAGKLVGFGEAAELGAAISAYISEPETLAAARAEAVRVGATFGWPAVAAETAAVLREAVAAAPRRAAIPDEGLELHEVRTDHLLTLVDDCGVIQHANGAIPNRYTGYCVDDVARLAIVALELERRTGDKVWSAILYRSLAFLSDATDDTGKGMRNFMTYDRPLARRRACRRPRRTCDLVARRRAHDRMGAGARRACAAGARIARRLVRERAAAAHRGVHGTRPRASRSRPSRAGGAAVARPLRDAARAVLCRNRGRGLALVRGRAQVRQRASVAGVDPRRRRPRPPGGDRDRSGQPRVAR